jgi:hypothetical protein
LCAGKATTSIGLASSLDRNYRRYVACERRVQYLQDPGHHGVLREDIDGEREELQKELAFKKLWFLIGPKGPDTCGISWL